MKDSYLTRIVIFVTGLVLILALCIGIDLCEKNEGLSSYMITAENRFDYQSNLECSGYSSAFVLRSLGIDADGLDLYKKIEGKNADGTVNPDTLTEYLCSLGYKANLYFGDEKKLKAEIAKGAPVIAFVRISPGSENLHYLPIVGYDETNFYAAESEKYITTGETAHYNRIITHEDFAAMWKTGVTDDNLYITISK